MSTTLARQRATLRPTTRKPRALVLRAPGTNCDRETVLALETAGARVETVHLDALLAGGATLDSFGMVVLPGGFSFGDHLGAGALWAHRLEALGEPLRRFVADGRPVLGICNGFQALMKLGLLSGGSLAANASGHFECRWVWMRKPAAVTTPLLAGVERIAMPVAHGEGRFVVCDRRELGQMEMAGEVALLYCDAEGNPTGYPGNPNGSDGDVAALVNPAGNVLGIMPHPERNVAAGLAPAGREDGAGLAIFRNAVQMARG